ncbi:MAG: serine/threonine protein kinase [Mycobacteriaceae bacterium]|nr:serine/threonine protein kinase [Mycobacteriaceae bacterium]
MNVGQVLGGRYELRGVLGRGGMAEVRDGWDMRLNRAVAVKLLYPGIGAQRENRLRFETEARAAAGLSSRHIVVVHDVGEQDGVPFIVMERLPGVSLAHHIARGPLSPVFVHQVLDDVLGALSAAHDAGILHRDIKPGNILFTTTGEAKLTDFGIAKTADAAYTATGQLVGTMAYLSPERLAGHPATVSDDLYSVGVVGYEALSGRRPFPQQELGPLARAILNDQPTPLGVLRPDVDPVLLAAIERATARDPGWRFREAGAMRAAIAETEFLTMPVRPVTRVMPVPPVPTYGPWPADDGPGGSRRKVWAAAAILAALALAIILLALDSPFSSAPTPATTTTPTAPTTTVTTPSPTVTTTAPLPPPTRPGRKPKHGGGD